MNSFLNPLLVQVMACGYLFNFYRGKPLVKKGGTLIITHPCSDAFDPDHHPSYHAREVRELRAEQPSGVVREAAIEVRQRVAKHARGELVELAVEDRLEPGGPPPGARSASA